MAIQEDLKVAEYLMLDISQFMDHSKFIVLLSLLQVNKDILDHHQLLLQAVQVMRSRADKIQTEVKGMILK
jgi:hypothetical protein